MRTTNSLLEGRSFVESNHRIEELDNNKLLFFAREIIKRKLSQDSHNTWHKKEKTPNNDFIFEKSGKGLTGFDTLNYRQKVINDMASPFSEFSDILFILTIVTSIIILIGIIIAATWGIHHLYAMFRMDS